MTRLRLLEALKWRGQWKLFVLDHHFVLLVALFVFFSFFSKRHSRGKTFQSLLLNLTAEWKIRTKSSLNWWTFSLLFSFFFFVCDRQEHIGTLDMNYSRSVHVVFLFVQCWNTMNSELIYVETLLMVEPIIVIFPQLCYVKYANLHYSLFYTSLLPFNGL